MLVLNRKRGEQIVIGDGSEYPRVVIVVNKIKGDRVSLGIEAPLDVKVMRAELQTTSEQ